MNLKDNWPSLMKNFLTLSLMTIIIFTNTFLFSAGVNDIESVLQEEEAIENGINNDLGIHPYKTGVFTPAEIRQKSLDERTESLEVKQKRIENNRWEIVQSESGSYILFNEGIQNEYNVAWLDHLGNCSFRLYFTMQQGKNAYLDKEIGLAINWSNGNIDTIYLILEGISDDPLDETKVLHHYPSKVISWEDLWELRNMNFITFTPPAESNFDFSYEKWSFKHLFFRRNQMKQDLGCED